MVALIVIVVIGLFILFRLRGENNITEGFTWSRDLVSRFNKFRAALEYAMKLYNETAAKRLLSWNTKEGQFLLYGGKSSDGSAIKCSDNTEKNSSIQKTTLHGYNLWNGYKNTTTTDIANENIPKEMPGFSFVNKPCNPCVILDDPTNYSCPFRLNVEGDNEISDIWKQLWNV